MKSFPLFKYPLTTGLFWGTLGGILFSIFLSLQGKVPTWVLEIPILIIYILIIALSLVTVRLSYSFSKNLSLFLSNFIALCQLSLVVSIFFLITSEFHQFRWQMFIFNVIFGFIISALATFLVTRNLETNSKLSIINTVAFRSVLFGLVVSVCLSLLLYFVPKPVSFPLSILMLIACPLATTINLNLKALSSRPVELYLGSFTAYVIVNISIYLSIYFQSGFGFNWFGFWGMSFIGFIGCALQTFLITRNRLAYHE